MDPRTPEIVHVGSASRDLAPSDPRGWRLGGGVTYAALTTARLGLHTAAVVGVDGLASGAAELDLLRGAGVELELVVLDEGPVFNNIEGPTSRTQVAYAVGRLLRPRVMPEAWRAAGGWSLVAVAGELDDDWLELIPERAQVALGWQGWLRWIVAGQRVRRRAPTGSRLLHRADLVGVSRDDLDPGTDIAALTAHLGSGTRLVVTDGRGGGEVHQLDPSGPTISWTYPGIASTGEVDPTGAGDVFLATLMAVGLRPALRGSLGGTSPADLRLAAAAGSLAVEGLGLLGVPDLERVMARARRRGP